MDIFSRYVSNPGLPRQILWLIFLTLICLSSCEGAGDDMLLPLATAIPEAELSPIPTYAQTASPTDGWLKSPTAETVYAPTHTPKVFDSPVISGTRAPDPGVNSKPLDLPADLLYLSDGSIWRWDHDKMLSVELVNPILGETITQEVSAGHPARAQIDHFSVDAAQRFLALSISRGIAANGVALYDLGVVDLEKNELSLPITQTRRIDQLQLSPDGKWISYITQDSRLQLNFLPVGQSLEKGVQWESDLEVIDTLPTISWMRDSRRAAWSDQRGIWVYEAGRDSPRLIFDTELALPDRSGELVVLRAVFNEPEWSPHGRYLKVELRPVGADAHWTIVLDTLMNRIAEVPGTYTIGGPSTEGKSIWMPDGKLLVIAVNVPDPGQGAVNVFNVLPASDKLLVLDETIHVELSDTNEDEVKPSITSSYLLHAIQAINSRYVSFVVGKSEEGVPSNHYLLDLKYHIIKLLGPAPHDIVAIHWAENTKGALLLGKHGAMIYQSRDGTLSYDLYPLFGNNQAELIWFKRNIVSNN